MGGATSTSGGHGPLRRLDRRVAVFFRRLAPWQRRLLGGLAAVAVLGLAGGVLAVVLTRPAPPPAASSGNLGSHPKTVASSTSIPVRHSHAKVCPLTGTPAPGKKVPQRPAVGVKIGNDPASRPQSGLLQADVVYDAMAEGGITRYLAVFQCHEAASIGPTRSVRWNDWHLLASYGHPILAFSGGIQQWDAAVASERWLFDANGSTEPTAAAFHRTANRVPPWNYYTSTAALWALDPSHQAPPQQFLYSRRPAPHSAKVRSFTIANFDTSGSAGITNLTWTWSERAHVWLRSYGGIPDVDSSGVQLRATNVIVQFVDTVRGPYAESGTVPDTESITQGSGQALVFRDGRVERGSWKCRRYGDVTAFVFGDGVAMTLHPGSTWVELVPVNGYPVSVVP